MQILDCKISNGNTDGICSADEKFDASFPVNIIVKHTGDILIAPPGIIKSSCEIDITWFPFDEQICNLRVKFYIIYFLPEIFLSPLKLEFSVFQQIG